VRHKKKKYKRLAEDNRFVVPKRRPDGDKDVKSLHHQQIPRWFTDVGAICQQWYVYDHIMTDLFVRNR